MRRPAVLALITVLAGGLSLHAQSNGVQAHAVAASSSTLVVDFKDDISHLDTGKCYDTECYPFMKAMYDRLVDYQGAGATIVPDAAAAMPKLSNNGKTYTFQLRKNVHFWNGKLATSADWVYSFDRIIDPKTQAGAASFWNNVAGAQAFAKGKAKSVSGIKATGKWGLQITLNSPDASFLNVLAMPFGSVVDKATIAKYGKSYDSAHPMGTGPYMFKSHQLGQKLVLVKNPHYFGGNVGKVSTIEADYGVDTNTAFLRIKAGQADLDGDQPAIPPAEFTSVQQDPQWKGQIEKNPQVADWYIAMNTQMKYFSNKLVRQAVNMAINKQLILRLIQNRGTVATTFLPPNMPGYGKFDLYPYNPAKAKQTLAKAGYPNGFSTTFYSDDVSDDPRIAQAIIPMLAQIGIKASLKIVNGNTWQQLVGTKGKVPITWTAWFQDFPDPNDFVEPILSCASAVPGTFNEPWYCNPKVDKVAAKLKAMTNRTQRLAQYVKLDKMIMQDAPVVPVYHPVLYQLRSKAVKTFVYSGVWGYVFQDMVKS
jgi:ABC-type oligopeptide transport system substrate-binding subunit